MNRILGILTLCLVSSVVACGDSDSTVKVVVFQATPDAIESGQSTTLVFAVEPSDAKISISDIGDVTGQTSVKVTPGTTTTYQLTATSGSATQTQSATVTVGATSASAIRIEPGTTTPIAGEQLSVTLTVLGSDGKPAPGFRGTVHLTSTDAKAALPGDLTFTADDKGQKPVTVTLRSAGLATLTATDTSAKAGVQGSVSVTVGPAAAATYQMSTLPQSAAAGQALVLTITVKDAFGNTVTGYAGQAQVTSTDATDLLPADGGFTSGVRSVNLAFTRTGSHAATVADKAGVIAPATTTSVDVSAGSPFQVAVTVNTPLTTAGTAESLTARIIDFYGNTVAHYTGTLHFVSDDPLAEVPADFTFGAGDGGSHSFTVTPRTGGRVSVAISDTAAPTVMGTASWLVGSAPATKCIASQGPTTAVAGSVLGLTVTLRDSFGNVATGYDGTIRVTASDLRASLPADVTYVPSSDAGSHAFSAQLLTAGNQVVTATDTANAAIQCALAVSITPAAPKLVLSVPANANAGYAVNVGVTVKDLYDNAIPGFTGQVTFTSSDTGSGAATPGAITFTGSEGGVATTTATFVTIGAQTVTASTAGSPAATGSATAQVHGLVYTAPSGGRVRLIANAAASTSQVVQLDLVAGERLELSSFFNGAIGSFAAGMNLPLDTTRVGADTTLFTAGSALPAGAGARAAIGRIGADHVLYTAVSNKRAADTDIFAQSSDVAAGQVFYSVRLKLTPAATVGPVFDGAQLLATYRAAVRDQFGDDFVRQSEFGVGRLEVR